MSKTRTETIEWVLKDWSMERAEYFPRKSKYIVHTAWHERNNASKTTTENFEFKHLDQALEKVKELES